MFTNRLVHESSLYLKQHAHNPVEWFPWGPEAIARAKAENKPIFLSIGYSACHWCHVMEHESFENEAVGQLMNEHFLSIKVDREERPDLDQIYMTAHHLLNRGEGGGWPLSVFLTPDLKPFYAGTYFPPDDRYAPQRPSFPKLLLAVANAWHTKPEQLAELGGNVAEGLQSMGDLERNEAPLTAELIAAAASKLKRSFDRTHGGFGYAPKFPHAMELKLLLRQSVRAGSVSDDANSIVANASGSEQLVTHTLEKMARGGIYDQIGGGFARYSVDAVWLVPHFEKMLYDNALLVQVLVEAFQRTGDLYFQQIARETLDYVLREMTAPSGGFYSTQDADSEGEEGKFYVWSEAEIETILGSDARFAQAVWGTSPGGNFEGHNILCRHRSDAEDARIQRMELAEFRAKLKDVSKRLYDVRSKRVWPGRDEKHLTAWNALMIAAFAQAGTAFDEPRYVRAAVAAAEFLLINHTLAPLSPGGRGVGGEGDLNNTTPSPPTPLPPGERGARRLFRTSGANQPAKLTGYLEDYAYLADALVSVYEATFEARWIDTAVELAEAMLAHFADPQGGFFFTANDHEELIVRTKDLQDGSVPSGNSMAATALLRLAKLTGRSDFYAAAEGTLRAYRSLLGENPMAAGQMLNALDFYLGPVEEYAILGNANDPETVRVLKQLRGEFQPNRVIAFHDPHTGEAPAGIPLLHGKTMIDGRVSMYVCKDFACRAPVVGFVANPAATNAS